MQKTTLLKTVLIGLLGILIPQQACGGRRVIYIPSDRTTCIVRQPVYTPYNPALSAIQGLAGAVSIASVGYGCYHAARALKYWLMSSDLHDEREEYIRQETSDSTAKVFGGLGVGLISGVVATSRDSYELLVAGWYAMWGYAMLRR